MISQTKTTDKNAPTQELHNRNKVNDEKPPQRNFKLKGIWRETQLAQPKMPQDKYVPPYDGPLRLCQKSLVIDVDILQRCNHLAFANFRTIQDNKIDYKQVLDDKKMKNLLRLEDKLENSIYFLYRKYRKLKLQMELKSQKRKQTKGKHGKKKSKKDVEDKEQEEKAEHLRILALPKKSFKSPPPSRGKWKPVDQMTRYLDLAEPIKREVAPPRNIYVISEEAKNYVATENILRMAQPPKRFQEIEPPMEAVRQIPKSALTYKMTPGMERLYTVKIRKEGATAAPEEDIWRVSPAALLYKATPRMLQLAKPIDRK